MLVSFLITPRSSVGQFVIESLSTLHYNLYDSSPIFIRRVPLVSVLSGSSISGVRLYSSAPPSNPPADCATLLPGPSVLANTGVHRASPSMFYLPGMRSLPFWTAPSSSTGERGRRIAFGDRVVGEVVAEAEAHWEKIREEYLNGVRGGFSITEDYGDSEGHASLHEGSWEWHSFLKGGVPANRSGEHGDISYVCPIATKMILGGEYNGGGFISQHLFKNVPFGYAFFSTLGGDSSIKPHCGPMNLRLRIHLPLLVPRNSEGNLNASCGIRVGGQVREWEEGKAIVLDDAYEHEVWNKTSGERVILLFDIWHPDVHPDERVRIVEMFRYAKDQGWIGKK